MSDPDFTKGFRSALRPTLAAKSQMMPTPNPIQDLYTKRGPFYQWLYIDVLGWGRELATFFRRSSYLRSHLKILDAGCGTGIITRILDQIAHEQGYDGLTFQAFDLTPAMLAIFQKWITARGATNIEVQQADVLRLDRLPAHWQEYDLIVSSAMLEYLPKHQVPAALRNLQQLLREGGILLVVITRRNWLTRWLGQGWWKTQVYEAAEIQRIFQEVGFTRIQRKAFTSL